MWDENFFDSFIFEGYDLIGDTAFSFAIPKGTPLPLRRRLMAASKSYFMQYASIDYVMKRYGKYWFEDESEDEGHALIPATLSQVAILFDDLRAKHDSLQDLPDHFGLFVAGGALKRLLVSFKMAAFALQHGLYIECNCIMKLMLEQIAWAYAVHQIEDDKLLGVNPTRTISLFKRRIPTAGLLYGILNKTAHLDPKLAVHQLYSFGDNESYIKLTDEPNTLKSLLHLIAVVDMFGVVLETIYRTYFPRLDYIARRSQALKKNRPAVLLYKRIKETVASRV